MAGRKRQREPQQLAVKSGKGKKYAQLVEAQSPEPQETAHCDTREAHDESTTPPPTTTTTAAATATTTTTTTTTTTAQPNAREQKFDKNQNSRAIKIDMPTTTSAPPQPQQQQPIEVGSAATRKESQCSQVSTVFPSCSSTISDSQMNSCAANSTSSGRGTNLTRTISRSMLELDQKCGAFGIGDGSSGTSSSSSNNNRFQVTWTNLTFSHEPGLLGSLRLPACLRGAGAGFERKISPVLDNISGSFGSNQLIAIIGPSGCGKTTLLRFLAGNNRTHSDRLLISGLDEPKVAFIGQDDCLLPGLTARETLIYASRLQNTDPSFDHHQHIQPILSELGLHECADRSVTKLSGGQVKRVTIGQELLYPTNILILDELTSGLDASTSYSIVKLLKQLVSDHNYPMSIVMSIHQPSARLFAVFDQVYVMSEGRCLYEGSCSFDQVNAHLGRFNLECPKYHNIADYLIEIASDDLSSNQLVKEQLVSYQRKHFQLDNSHEQKISMLPLNDHNGLLDDDDDDADADADADEHKSQAISMLLMSNNHQDNRTTTNGAAGNEGETRGTSLFAAIEKARSRRARPIMMHFWVHLSRSMLRIRRSYILTYLQFVTYIVLGLQLSTFFGRDIGTLSGCPRLPLSFMAFVFATDDSETDTMTIEMRRIQENLNFLLIAIMTATFAALEITVITFPMEAKTVKREWRNGWYRVSSYFMGRSLADLPFQVLFVVTFCAVIYSLTGQLGLTTWRFASFVTIIMMTALVAQTIGFIFGAIFMDNLPAAVFTAPLCIFPALLFSGFFSRVSQVPAFYKPMTYVSHFRYAFDALVATLYGYNRCECDQDALDSYHLSQENQTSTMRTMFQSLFGSSECLPNSGTTTPMNSDENSIEDLLTTTAPQPSSVSLGSLIINATANTIKPKIHTLEDALVEGVFEHMKNTTDMSSNTSTAPEGESAMDHLAYKFSNRVTSMLNSRSNYGHDIPKQCAEYKPYLIAEFDIHNDDLLFGLMMLVIAVVVSRILCNIILSFTIATRAT